jgi:hypothetical protein
MFRVALFRPPDRGENTTSIEQLEEDATVCPEQLSFWRLYSKASVPVRVIVPTKRSNVPTFEILTLDAMEALSGTVPKSSDDGITEIMGFSPVPVTGTSSVHALGVFDEIVT